MLSLYFAPLVLVLFSFKFYPLDQLLKDKCVIRLSPTVTIMLPLTLAICRYQLTMLGWDEDPHGLRYPECNDNQLGSDMDVGSNLNTELGVVGLRSCWQEITTIVTVAQMKKKKSLVHEERIYILQ